MTDEHGSFGEHVADLYDASSDRMFEPAVVEPTVDFLAALAGDGRALEFGIGTGRIALPLAGRRVEVHGIDLSRPHGRPAACEAGRGEDRRQHRRPCDDDG